MSDLAPDDTVEPMARVIFATAIRDNQSGALFNCLIEGGSATVDAITGKLVLVTADMLAKMFGDADA